MKMSICPVLPKNSDDYLRAWLRTKIEQIDKMTTIFTQNDNFWPRTIRRGDNHPCFFWQNWANWHFHLCPWYHMCWLLMMKFWISNITKYFLWILFMVTFYWQNKFLIAHTRKFWPIKLSFFLSKTCFEELEKKITNIA